MASSAFLLFELSLTTLLADFDFKSKIIEVSHEVRKCF